MTFSFLVNCLALTGFSVPVKIYTFIGCPEQISKTDHTGYLRVWSMVKNTPQRLLPQMLGI
jgi:hypothetical protein